jgi:AraC-like DNA-binding protein
MSIRKFLPAPALATFIKEYIIIETDEEVQNKTLPDLSVVMSFRIKGTVLRVKDEREDKIPATAISGLRKTPRIFRYSGSTRNLLIIFKAGGMAAFSKIPVHELFEFTVDADNIFKASILNDVHQKLADANSDQAMIGIIEAFLTENLSPTFPDSIIYKAVQLIEKQRGIIRIKEFASNFNISQDPFEKRFRKVIGSSPKQFASILRLRHLIKTYPALSSLTDASYQAGYFDQSHFIKDFKSFTGETPKGFFKSSLYW